MVLARGDGTIVRLSDIAEVRDDFQDVGLIVRHENEPAAFVEVSRVGGEHVMDVATTVHEHVANVIALSLPGGVEVDILNDESQTYAERVADHDHRHAADLPVRIAVDPAQPPLPPAHHGYIDDGRTRAMHDPFERHVPRRYGGNFRVGPANIILTEAMKRPPAGTCQTSGVSMECRWRLTRNLKLLAGLSFGSGLILSL